jgi:membrane-bound metal-dependent hydrolase YbcI (DUF457 family)
VPFTPFHFGPCAALALPLSRRIDLPVFLLSNVAVDLEPYTVMTMRLDLPVHGLFHTYTVGSLVALAWACAAWPMRGLFARAMGFFRLAYETSFKKILFSSLLGVWFHVLLDSMLYPEMRPFFPLGGNAMLGALSVEAVYRLCAVAFVPALWLYFRARKKVS